MNIEWLLREIVEHLHNDLIYTYGGLAGLRDENLLEASLARPQHLLAYKDSADIFDLAAAYGYAIAKNHPFVDGNKRTAFDLMFVFLQLNGYDLVVEQGEALIVMLKLAEGSLNQDTLSEWLRSHSQLM